VRGGKLQVAFQHALDQRGIFGSAHQEQYVPRVIDKRKSKRQPPGAKFRDKVRDHAPDVFLQRCCLGKQRRGVSLVSEAEQNRVVPINRFTALGSHEIEMVLIFLRRDLRINFAGACA